MHACSHQPWLAIAKATPSQQQEIDRLLEHQGVLEDNIRRAFIDAVNNIQDDASVRAILAALNAGDTAGALQEAQYGLTGQGLSGLSNTLQQQVLEAAGATAAAPLFSSAVGAAPGVADFSFGTTNAQVGNFLQTYPMNLIYGLNAEAQQNVKTTITQGVNAGINPLDIARNVRDFIGLTPRQVQAVQNFRRYLETLDSAALDRALRDGRFDRTLLRAIRDGNALTQDQIDRMVARYAERYKNFRAQTIARTEATRALNAGNHLLWSQAAEQGLVDPDSIIRHWIYTHDLRTRTAHRLIPSMNPEGRGLNEPFLTIDGPLLYPGDPDGSAAATCNCRCTLVYRTKLPTFGSTTLGGVPANAF